MKGRERKHRKGGGDGRDGGWGITGEKGRYHRDENIERLGRDGHRRGDGVVH